jgi:hypothetical protein
MPGAAGPAAPVCGLGSRLQVIGSEVQSPVLPVPKFA